MNCGKAFAALLGTTLAMLAGCGGSGVSPDEQDGGYEWDAGTPLEDGGVWEEDGGVWEEDGGVWEIEDAGAPDPLSRCASGDFPGGLSCGNHGSCVDMGNFARCQCEEGYVGFTCEACDVGYRRQEGKGACVLSTEKSSCVELDCGGHGSCLNGDGKAEGAACACDKGYAGSLCDACAPGYQDRDGDGTCEQGCALSGLEGCSGHGTCGEATGKAVCACALGYAGEDCGRCAAGYVPQGVWGGCGLADPSPDCAGFDCSGTYRFCDMSGDLGLCVCETGYADLAGDGSCSRLAAPVTCGQLDCGEHASCRETFAGAACACDKGYQDNDHDGVCQLDCTAAGLSGCGGHGVCSSASGTAVCTCHGGYEGAGCESCAPGFQDDGNGFCREVPAAAGCALLDCGDHAACAEGVVVPSCACDEGYQDNDRDGVCQPDCGTAALEGCGGHGVCGSVAGIAACTCRAGYAGASCGECDEAAGYRSDGGGACVLKSASEMADWTFIVYLNGDNNLGCMTCGFTEQREECAGKEGREMLECLSRYDLALTDMLEMYDGMAAAGESADRINVVVLFDDAADSPAESLSPGGVTRIYRITRKGAEALAARGVFPGVEADMGAAGTLMRFGVWAVRNYPARNYALDLWDHGEGWRGGAQGGRARRGGRGLFRIGGAAASAPEFRAYSDDYSSFNSISIGDGTYAKVLDGILSEVRRQTPGKEKIDLVGFDACLMGMYEVAEVTSKYSDYMVASEDSEPGTGWDYGKILEKLGRNPAMTPEDLAMSVMDAYIEGQGSEQPGEVTTMSVFDLSAMEALTGAMDGLGDALKAAVASGGGDRTMAGNVRAIAESAQRFMVADHADLKHLAKLLKGSDAMPAAVKAAAGALLPLLDKAVPASGQNNCENAGGMAVFFPPAFNCCITYTDAYDPYVFTLMETMDEYLECPHVPYSYFDCFGQGIAGGRYSHGDVLPPRDGAVAGGAYYEGPWSRGWREFLGVYYDFLLD